MTNGSVTDASVRAGNDPGLQNERTAFAWQRTALAVLASAAVVARLMYPTLGWCALLGIAFALVATAWVFRRSRLRYRRTHAVAEGKYARGGTDALLITAAVLLMGLLVLAAILG